MDVSFGPYRLFPAQRLLLEGDKPVRLGSRAFDILTILVERAGEVVSKEELIARVWPATFVEETNLKIQVSALRRALGDGQGDNRYVATVVGRGYNFVAPIREEAASLASPSPAIAPAAPHNLPFATTRMIGREEIVATLVAGLSRRRLVTVAGPGGVGKSTIALAVAERMIGTFDDGVWLVDLAPLRDPGLVPGAVAAVPGLEVRTNDPLPGLVVALRDRRVLLLLDNCEHVVDAAAGLTAALLSGTPGVTILATSREPLGVPGERVHRIGPLNGPEPSPGLTAEEAMAFPAVQLFVERVTASVEDFALTDAKVSLVAAICQRLDGLPLAIEFAAPRVEALGVEGLAARLDDSFRRLSGARRRAALPRHRTMRAVIDWSYGLLNEDEQQFFRALGTFAGGFDVKAAAAVGMEAAAPGPVTIARLADLVAKSLVVADVSGPEPRFRLLDTMSAFALEKLGESGEFESLTRRHAAYYRDLFERAEDEVSSLNEADWLSDYAREIDNVRAALDRMFSPGGLEPIAIALTAASVPLWVCLSLLVECRDRADRALAALVPRTAEEARHEMKLRAAVAGSLIFIRGGGDPETALACTRALEIAETLGDAEYQLRALRGLWSCVTASGRHRIALELARRFRTLAAARPDPNDQLSGEGIIGVSEFYLGDLTNARRHLERMLDGYAVPGRPSHITRFQTDQLVVINASHARLLWLQGFPDQAAHGVHRDVEHARDANHIVSLCQVLVHAALPIALWIGDPARAEAYATMLVDNATRRSLAHWRICGRCFQGLLVIGRGDITAGSRLLRAGIDELGKAETAASRILAPLIAEALGRAGQTVEGLVTIDEAIARAERTDEHWTMAELQRVKGELLLSRAGPQAAIEAEQHFRSALDWARRQGALSWELRAATSLARLLRNQSKPADAITCIRPVYERFMEGFDTADLAAAKQLLDDLGGAGRR